MTDNLHPEVSKYMSDLNRRRKNKRGGFNDPKVQAQIQAKRKAKKLGSEAQG